ncbi:TIGR02253 family HAD-type hydrolase [Candidatus Micrarchaeota archaeon]|nr:TIGR02253 family HAD-type hydrolase [Candidatus Micrarchaeota archaeon]
MLKHILFDIDDTLFPSTEFSNLARKNAINAIIAMGTNADFDRINKELSKIIKKRGSNYPYHFNDLCKSLKIKSPSKYVAAAIAAYHDSKTAIAPYPKVPLTLLALKEKGLKIYAATNGNPTKQWDKLIRLRIALYFDDVFVSEEIGAQKGPSFYRKILNTLNAKPTECLMVGDREDFDIKPAKALGMHTVRILTGKYSDSRNKSSGADFTIKDIGEIPKIVKQL